MCKLFSKVNKYFVVVLAGILTILYLVLAIMKVAYPGEDTPRDYTGLANSVISCVAIGLLMYFLIKDQKSKGTVIVMVLIGGAILTNLGNSIDLFRSGADLAGSVKELEQYPPIIFNEDDLLQLKCLTAAICLVGASTLVLFLSVGSHIALKVADKGQKPLKIISTYGYLLSTLAALAAVLLVLLCGVKPNVTSVIGVICMLLEAFLLSVLVNKDF